MDPITGAITGDITQLLGTVTTFSSGAIASAISGNPLYSNDPAAAGYAVAGAAAATPATVNGNNLVILLAIGYFIFKVVK